MQRTLYCGLSLAVALVLAAGASAETVAITVDATAGQKPIDPRIYGVAFGTQAALTDLNCPLNRQGGNNMSRYNWNINTCNLDNDWYFESLPPSNSTAGQAGDSFISASKTAGAQAMLTIPMIGWAAKLGPGSGKLCSFSIAKYGAQTGSDQWYPDAGNGILSSNNQYVVNDPTDANLMADTLFQQNQTEWLKLNPADAGLAVDTSFQQNWVNHLVDTWNTAANGGLRYYLLDNEHSIWHSTHRDVHPIGATMDEISSKMIAYATMIKTIDPGALILGPEEWGWDGYFYSGYDQQYGSLHGWSYFPDRAAHAGQDFAPWFLRQVQQRSQVAGKRLIDVFSLHYYPQGGESLNNDISTATQLLRNRSTRSLWDTNYVDQSWINSVVMLIPRMKNWVAANYPGTLTGITEYNWGADDHMNGATAQADILGIFGREGLDLAARWTCPNPGTPAYNAFKMFRNYDGNRSTFGDTSVLAAVPDPDKLAAFAAVRASDRALTVMVINKDLKNFTPVTLHLADFAASGTAQVWQLAAGNIGRLNNLTFTNSVVSSTLPAQSVTLFILPPAVLSQPLGAQTSSVKDL